MKISDMLTVKEAAKKLDVSTKTLRRWETNGYFVPEKKGTIRLYNPIFVGYLKRVLELDRSIRKHLMLLQYLRERLNKYNLEQEYVPGERLKLMTEEDVKRFLEASKAMEKWRHNYDEMLKKLMKYPKSLLQTTTEEY